jgi:hypothetical protein
MLIVVDFVIIAIIVMVDDNGKIDWSVGSLNSC